jgi:hypothetical protein
MPHDDVVELERGSRRMTGSLSLWQWFLLLHVEQSESLFDLIYARMIDTKLIGKDIQRFPVVSSSGIIVSAALKHLG